MPASPYRAVLRNRCLPVPTGINALSLSLVLLISLPKPSARADGSIDYNFEDYSETGGRVGVHTQGLIATQDLPDAFKISATEINDAIAGAGRPVGVAPAIASLIAVALILKASGTSWVAINPWVWTPTRPPVSL